jgi:hypothetical protein
LAAFGKFDSTGRSARFRPSQRSEVDPRSRGRCNFLKGTAEPHEQNLPKAHSASAKLPMPCGFSMLCCGPALALPVFAVMFVLLWIVYRRRPARPT